MKNYHEFNKLTDSIPSIEVEKGIAVVVGILNTKGLITQMSCEGHNRSKPWVSLCPAHFKGYMDSSLEKMKQFLIAGEGRWNLEVNYFGQSLFHGIGQKRPRKSKLKRVVQLEMDVKIVLDKNKDIKSMERAARELL